MYDVSSFHVPFQITVFFSTLQFQEIKVNNSDESEQMKSNKTGSHITGRATNGHRIGSNSFFPCVSTEMGEKPISSGQKASCHFAEGFAIRSKGEKNRSVKNFV